MIRLETANNNVKQRGRYTAEDDQRQNENSEMMGDNLGERGTSNTSRSKDKPKVISVPRVDLDVKQRIEYAAKDDECRNNDGESMEGDEDLQTASTSHSSRANRKPQVMSVQRVNSDVKRRTRYEAGGDQRRNDVQETMNRNNDDNSDSDGSDEPRANRRVELKVKKRKSDRMEPTLMRKILNDIQGALKYYEEQPDIDEYGREMYDVEGRKIYLGEGVEVSATAWFLIKHELFSDYLVEKNFAEEEVIKWLRRYQFYIPRRSIIYAEALCG